MTLAELRLELPSNVWRLSAGHGGEVLGFVTGDDPLDVLHHALRIKKLRHRGADQLLFRRLTIREVIRLRDRGITFH